VVIATGPHGRILEFLHRYIIRSEMKIDYHFFPELLILLLLDFLPTVRSLPLADYFLPTFRL
jgi:hypothetical protein